MGTRTKFLLLLLVATSFWPNLAKSQQPPPTAPGNPMSYDARRETSLVGTVQAYTNAPQAPPFGTHVTLQTSTAVVDVHLGDPKFLAANHFAVQPGDTLRIVGETVSYGSGTQFVARIVQKGTQALMVRSVRGIPLSYAAPRNNPNPKRQGSVL
jgi:hypothetical protein